ncbi:MAG TPA: hypothetical protein VN702_19340 [Acetobacteraceae bacterium]|nr:hypothetical protein [Acetobacteraceae bacterium]
MPDDLEAPRHVVEDLGDILAETGHAAATIGASAGAAICGLMDDLLPREMVRQRLALGLGALADRRRAVGGLGLGDLFGLAGLQLFELKLKLLDLAGDAFRGAAELHPPELGDLELELLDL